ncbi:MAG TPA: PhzF family phenazine biosynthesis protein [Candidatus Baltobacteraceae bacterium]|nr:PhzF family phenazine biosynthesis protein [Candidatus Baltobacteraceae bacterium]
MIELAYSVVDVFTRQALEGNALAVFHDGRALDGATMQRIAREMNLSETTFVLPPAAGDAVDVRIFTPAAELPFAGHPTIGTAFVLRERGIVARDARAVVLREPIGPVPVHVDEGDDPMIWLRTPEIRFGETVELDAATAAVGLDVADALADATPQLVSAGNPSVFLAVRDPQTVDRAAVDLAAYRRLVLRQARPTCVFVFAPVASGAYSRMFAPDLGITEDPATGSATGPLAAYMMRNGLVSAAGGTRFVSEQGTKMGRRSLLHVHVRGEHGADGIDVGGHVVRVASGVVTL